MVKRVLVFGATGLAGTSICKSLEQNEYEVILAPNSIELDLRIRRPVFDYISSIKPDKIVLAAAKVGGIQANNTLRADFILDNLSIQQNCFCAALENNVSNFIFLGSNCQYPKSAKIPYKESSLFTGKVEPTNEPYAVAKLAGVMTAESISRQHGLNYYSIIPTSLYGEYDNFKPEEGHIISGVISRLAAAKRNGDKSFSVWGTGKPLREFMHADDLGDAISFLFSKDFKPKEVFTINIGSGHEFTIKTTVEKIAKLVGYTGSIEFDTSKPDGALRKSLDSSIINTLGWKPKIDFELGLERTIKFFMDGKSKRM